MLSTIRFYVILVVLIIADNITNWHDVIVICAVKVTTDTESSEEVATMTKDKIARLREICLDMNLITAKLVGVEESTVLQITMTSKSYTDVMDDYKSRRTKGKRSRI